MPEFWLDMFRDWLKGITLLPFIVWWLKTYL